MTYKLAIFDFDGTMADTFPWFVSHWELAARKYNLPTLTAEEIAQLRKLGAREVMKYLRLPIWKVPLVARYLRKMMTAEVSQIGVFPGIPELLAELRGRGWQLAMVTSNSEINARSVLGEATASAFTFFECGASLFGKTRHFKRVLKRAGIQPAEAISIGDEVRDFKAATALGIDFAAVGWGYTNAETMRALQPKLFFTRVEEMLGALDPADPATASGGTV